MSSKDLSKDNIGALESEIEKLEYISKMVYYIDDALYSREKYLNDLCEQVIVTCAASLIVLSALFAAAAISFNTLIILAGITLIIGAYILVYLALKKKEYKELKDNYLEIKREHREICKNIARNNR